MFVKPELRWLPYQSPASLSSPQCSKHPPSHLPVVHAQSPTRALFVTLQNSILIQGLETTERKSLSNSCVRREEADSSTL